MAGDRHGKHNTTTISFRVNSYEKATIEERVKVSGMKKQDYIVRSCIYNHVCVVGKKETIEIIRSEMKEMSLVLEDVAKDLKSEKPVISEPVLDSMTERYLAFLEAALWMLKGSSYLSDLIFDTYGNQIKIFPQSIPFSVRAAEISAEGISIFEHDPKGKVAAAYWQMTQEVLLDER